MNEDLKIHWILGGSLLVIFVLVIGYIVNHSQADEVITLISIDNEAPSVDSVVISSEANGAGTVYTDSTITLSSGTTTPVHVSGVISDSNGYEDITTGSGNVSVAFHRSGISLTDNSCTDDENYCYTVSDCTLTGGSGTTVNFDCPMDIEYWTDSTLTGGAYPGETWTATAKVVDRTAAEDILTASTEVDTLLSLAFSTTNITYDGVTALGASTTGANNEIIDFTQQGNDEADVKVSGVDMVCDTVGSIAIGNQQWSLNDIGYNGATTTDMTGSPVDTDLGVNYKTTSDETETLYWNILIPSTGVRGTCTGTTTITLWAAGA